MAYKCQNAEKFKDYVSNTLSNRLTVYVSKSRGLGNLTIKDICHKNDTHKIGFTPTYVQKLKKVKYKGPDIS